MTYEIKYRYTYTDIRGRTTRVTDAETVRARNEREAVELFGSSKGQEILSVKVA